MPLSEGFVTEYVPPTFKGAVVIPGETEFGGKVSVSTALAPGARFVTGIGAAGSEPEPRVVPATVTCSELTVTLPVFVTVTSAR